MSIRRGDKGMNSRRRAIVIFVVIACAILLLFLAAVIYERVVMNGNVILGNVISGEAVGGEPRSVITGYAGGSLGSASSISQYGITWYFDKEYEYGQFANGDYWVVGPVRVILITPSWDGTKHGSMIDPMPNQQGFDARASYLFNVSTVVTAPVTIPPNRSLVSAVSLDSPQVTYLKTAAVLTVLGTVPPDDALRPSYMKGLKKIYRLSEINRALLPNLAPVSNMPDSVIFADKFQRVWIDHVYSIGGQYRLIRPLDNMEEYSAISALVIQQASLMILVNDSNKEQLLRNFLQLGIDQYGILNLYGDGDIWTGGSGQANGHKWPIIFAGIMFNDENMKNLNRFGSFGEDDQVYYYDDPSLPVIDYWGWPKRGVRGWTNATVLFGQFSQHDESYYSGDYEHVQPSNWALVGRPGNSNLDGFGGEGYRQCCTSYTWVGQALAARLMNAMSIWNKPEFFDYVDRWMTEAFTQQQLEQLPVDLRRYGQLNTSRVAFVDAMWNRYRNYQSSCGNGIREGTEQCDLGTGNGACPRTCSTSCTINNCQTTYSLNVQKQGTGSGTVTSSPAGINCGSDCSENYNSGTLVTLTAAASSGSTFSSWGGACSGTGTTCTVVMNATKSVTATFNAPSISETGTFYIAANGSNSNDGKSKTAPWLHAPGMAGCSANCAATVPQPGNRFIFRGGDTWHAKTGSLIGLPWVWRWSGNATNPVYIGIDKTWFTGSSWSRPILNLDNPISTSQVSSCVYDETNFIAVILGSVNINYYLTFDNFEFTGKCWSDPPLFMRASDISLLGNHMTISNNYFHGWTHTACPSGKLYCDQATSIVGPTSPLNQNNHIVGNIFDGFDTDRRSSMAVYVDAFDFHHNIVRYVSNGVVGNNIHTVHDNLFEYINNSYDSSVHSNVLEANYESNLVNFVYNNVFRHNTAAVNIWTMVEQTDYYYNNVIYDTPTPSNCWDVSGTGGTVNFFNNLIVGNCPFRFAGNSVTPLFSGTANFINNHFIGSATTLPYFLDSGANPTIVQNSNLYQTEAVANAQGYTASNDYAPTNAVGATINTGANLSQYFTTDKDGVSRPQGSGWDIGAYEYTSGTPTQCTLSSATWSKTSANEGEQVQLRVSGTGCDGQSIGFVVKEDDVYSADDDVNVNPASVTFSNGAATGTWTAEYVGDELFSTPEYYFIATLTADGSKSIQSSSSSLLIVNPVSTQNRAPNVNAGNDQTITLPTNSVNLRGTVTDDDLPINGKLTATWSEVSGPGTVTFVNASNVSTSASFSEAGTYTLRLGVSDSQLTGSDDVIVTVNAQPGGENNTRLLSSITKDGITWTFDKAVPVGQFVTGDYYVVGSVTVIGITPAPTSSAPYRSGSVKNLPSLNDRSGFDDRVEGSRFDASMRTYPPITLNPRDSLVSSISVDTVGTIKRVMRQMDSTASPVRTVSVLTVLDNSVTTDAFRPSYCDRTQTIYYANNLNRNLLLSLSKPNPSATPPLSDFESWFKRPWLDVNQFLFDAPVEYMPDYGREVGFAVSYASLLLMLDFSAQQKMNLTNYLVQYGIDLFGCLEVSYSGWSAFGGHGSGRKLPIVFAGALLNNDRMKRVGDIYPNKFGEDMQMLYVNQTPPLGTYQTAWQGAKVVYGGHYGVKKDGSAVGTGQYGPYEHLQPRDWPGFLGENYRRCCTSNAWVGQALALRLLGREAMTVWNRSAFFDYADRWMMEDDTQAVTDILAQTGVDYSADWQRQGQTKELLAGGYTYNTFIDDMWTAYRNISITTTYTLTVDKQGTGSGTVTSSPAGINCGSDCSENYNSGTSVTLTVATSLGSTFSSWGGACLGTQTSCSVTMNANKIATAAFTLSQQDTTAPVISQVRNTSITQNSAVISWTTDDVSDSVVYYGTTTSLGTRATGTGSVTQHSVSLSSLTANTQYYYKVSSTNGNGLQSNSSMFSFRTLSAAVNQPPTVNAGTDRTITLPTNSVSLSGTATDDGLPVGSTVTITWSKFLGHGTVTFSNANALTTTAIFSAAGTYTLRLTATDSQLTGSDDLVVTVNTAVNQPPSVSLTAPLSGSTFIAPALITLTASASDSDGIQRVEFYNGATKLGEDASSPYSYVWSNAAAGSYSLTARAFDNLGVSAISSSVSVIVNEQTQPPSGETFTIDVQVGLNPFNIDVDGNYLLIGSVRAPHDGANSFYIDIDSEPGTANEKVWDLSITSVFQNQNVSLRGPLGNFTYSQFNPKIFNLTKGAHNLYIRIRESGSEIKNMTFSLQQVGIGNQPPEISLSISLLDGGITQQDYTAPAAFRLSANALDRDGSISRVEFYDGTRLLNSDTNSADGWVYVWANVSVGTYSITAKATDDKGASTETSPLAIRVVEPGALICAGTEPTGDGIIKGAGNYTQGAAITSWTYDISANGVSACLWRCDKEKGYKRSGNKCVYQNKLIRNDVNLRVADRNLIIEETETAKTLFSVENTNQTELNFSSIEIERNNLTDANAFMIIRNLTLSGKTKIIYLKPQNANANAICIADRENVLTKEDILANCVSVRCPGNAQGYGCEAAAGEFAVKGLLHSGIIEQIIVDQPPQQSGGGGTPSGGGGDYVPPKPKEKGKENATLPKPIPQAEEEEKKESGEFKNATLADKIQSELEKRIKNRTARVIVSIVILGALIAGIIIMFVVVWRRVSKDAGPRLSDNAGVSVR